MNSGVSSAMAELENRAAMSSWNGITDTFNDGGWSDADLTDLRNVLAHGNTIEDAAALLGRSGAISDVIEKADALGLRYRSHPLRPGAPARRITAANLVSFGAGRWGASYEFNDGTSLTIEMPRGSRD